ncbi:MULTISPECIES: RNA-guided endonuclease InsQ/TnpB family protein [Calothrix]|uniref:IS200/IS605 family element transposase accessory protein TnpB n=2 Tax=Calothrix TaxID=1186 RepID=A0ABR8A9I4_9CYAN|nr:MULTISPECIES: RNA-guided endonuclease TnpB family protein [Calothrix]MBD2196591.1 IS200/IS605 family element transposase accessory protein TnpB [Calothrix parietina FACHB-288]MBD2228044.1 IS200/IS605 family element transposase accessory protein TnpB [Calothrix anomala FACHB-343]
MLRVVKVRLYPDVQQQQSLAQAFGSCRWLWNYCLNLMNQTYKETGKGLSGYAVKKIIPQLKKEYEWLTSTYSQCLQQVCLNLGVAFNNFFERRAKYPRFKSKHGKQSIQYPQNVKVADNCLSLPKIGEVSAIIHRSIEGKVKTVTISKNCSNQYFAAILVDDGKDKQLSSTEGKAVGIDLGLTHFAITSDGSKFDNPRILNKHEKNLKLKQQQLSRKQKAVQCGLGGFPHEQLHQEGSQNRIKSRIKVARVHRKITNCREDFLHKLSRRIVNENQVIVVENLNVKGMMQNHCLAKSIQSVGWGMFCTMLKYKAEMSGKIYQEVDRFFPSSKTCHVCLNQVGSLPLDVRFWTCKNCHTKHDRDVNAAINLRDEGLRILTSGTGDKACRPDVSRSKGGRKKSTTTLSVGQEAYTVPSGQCR